MLSDAYAGKPFIKVPKGVSYADAHAVVRRAILAIDKGCILGKPVAAVTKLQEAATFELVDELFERTRAAVILIDVKSDPDEDFQIFMEGRFSQMMFMLNVASDHLNKKIRGSQP